MSFRCRECKYWIIDGKCACNSDGGQGRYVSSAVAELTRWAVRGVLPLSAVPATTGPAITGTRACRCLGCLYGTAHCRGQKCREGCTPGGWAQ